MVAAFAATVLAVGCGGAGAQSETVEGKIQATTTTTHVTDLVRSVGGDEVEVTALMGPGVDPHLYEASQGDISALRDADVVFYHGMFLEGRLAEILERVEQQNPAVQVTEGLPEARLLASEDYEGQADPHVWFDPELWEMTVDPVVEQLSELKPESAEVFERNGEAYREEIRASDAYVRERIEEIPEENRVLVTAHDAFGYFGETYGVEVRALQGISTESEAGAGDVRALAEELARDRVPALFTESSIPQRNIEAVQAAAQDRGWDLRIGGELYADAMGDPETEAGTYPGMMRANADTMAEALG